MKTTNVKYHTDDCDIKKARKAISAGWQGAATCTCTPTDTPEKEVETAGWEEIKNQLYFLKYDDVDDFEKSLKRLIEPLLSQAKAEARKEMAEEIKKTISTIEVSATNQQDIEEVEKAKLVNEYLLPVVKEKFLAILNKTK